MVVRVSSPAEGRVSLNGEDGSTGRKDAELVVLGLVVLHRKLIPAFPFFRQSTYEDLETRQRNQSGLNALGFKLLKSLKTKGNLRTCGDEGHIGYKTC